MLIFFKINLPSDIQHSFLEMTEFISYDCGLSLPVLIMNDLSEGTVINPHTSFCADPLYQLFISK